MEFVSVKGRMRLYKNIYKQSKPEWTEPTKNLMKLILWLKNMTSIKKLIKIPQTKYLLP